MLLFISKRTFFEKSIQLIHFSKKYTSIRIFWNDGNKEFLFELTVRGIK